MTMTKEEKYSRLAGLTLAIADFILGYIQLKPFIGQILLIALIISFVAKYKKQIVSHVFFSYFVSFIAIVMVMAIMSKVLGQPALKIF